MENNYEYTIEESRFGLFTSVLHDGTRMVTGPTEESVRKCTDEIHIPVMQGTFSGCTSEHKASVIDSKL